jgi:hypothetical protein
MGFTVKNHDARVVPLPTDVVEMLEARYKSRPPRSLALCQRQSKTGGAFFA